MSSELRNILSLSALALIWGSSFILMNRVLFDSNGEALYSPLALGSLRLFLAGLVLLPVALKHFSKLKSKHFWPIVVVGLFGNGIPAFLFAISLSELDSGLAGILNSLVPLFTVITGVLLFKLKLKKMAFLGVVFGFLGAVGLVLMKSETGNEGDNDLFYAFLIVIATICYSLSVNTIQHKLSGFEAVPLAALGLFLAAIPATVVLFFTDFKEVLISHPEGLLGLGYCLFLSALGTAFALMLFNRLVKESSAVFASMVTYLIPIVAVFWGMSFGEKYTVTQLLFGVVILLGVFIVKRSKKKSNG